MLPGPVMHAKEPRLHCLDTSNGSPSHERLRRRLRCPVERSGLPKQNHRATADC